MANEGSRGLNEYEWLIAVAFAVVSHPLDDPICIHCHLVLWLRLRQVGTSHEAD